MSEGIESTELANELIMEETQVDEGASQVLHWHKLVALSTLIFALLAALGGLLSGITAHESQVEKIEEVISFTVLEGDRVSVEVLKAKNDILVGLGEPPDEAELAAIRSFEEEIDEKRQEIFQEERFTRVITQTHLIFAISVTVLAAGISLSGMSVVVNMKWLWYVGMAFGLLGLIGVILGIVSMLA